MIKILYVHCAGPFGGSSRSLYEMLKSIPPGECEFNFLCQAGTSNGYFSKLGRVFKVAGLTQFDHGQYSYYRGLRWLVVLRELYYIPHVICAVLKAKRALGTVDVIHVNDFVGVVPALLLRVLFKSKVVFHVRSLVNDNNRLLRTRLVNYFLREIPDRVVCIDENVRKTIASDVNAEVVHNGLSIEPFKFSPDGFRTESTSSLRVAFVGNLLLQKGIIDLIKSAAILHAARRPVEFHIYGDSAKNSSGLLGALLRWMGLRQDVKQQIFELVKKNGLAGIVNFHGFVDDLQSVYQNIDVVCFPSHLNAPGRPVIEAAFFGRPAIVSVSHPSPDTLVPGVTGLAILGKDPEGLAKAIDIFISDRKALLDMGKNSKQLSEKYYDQQSNSNRILEIYRELLNGNGEHEIR
ncbi:glycosyltransferase [Variovorax sp. RB2P76]|uniref:glycosyltransferase n=1 Tax=Variovorax sp. RB2P76 TaxID=3443736 RepID=UPI003F4516F2